MIRAISVTDYRIMPEYVPAPNFRRAKIPRGKNGKSKSTSEAARLRLQVKMKFSPSLAPPLPRSIRTASLGDFSRSLLRPAGPIKLIALFNYRNPATLFHGLLSPTLIIRRGTAIPALIRRRQETHVLFSPRLVPSSSSFSFSQ